MRYLLTIFILSGLFFSCYQNKLSSEVYYEFDTGLKSKDDSIIQFIEYCDTKQFDKAISLYPFVKNFREEGGFISSSLYETISYEHFPFKEYSSDQLLILGSFLSRKYESNVRLLDWFLRNSIQLNSNNYLAIIELAKLGILGGKYLDTYCLLQFALKSDKYRGLARQMIEYCKENPMSKISEIPQCKSDLKWICENVYFGYIYMDYAGYNKFSKYKRKEN